jgi:hypothetical protein
LLTRKKPYIYRSIDDDGLVSHFVSLLTKGKLADIIDPQVMGEEDGEIQKVATLAATCTKLKGEDRPTMREVEMALESLLTTCLLLTKSLSKLAGSTQWKRRCYYPQVIPGELLLPC